MNKKFISSQRSHKNKVKKLQARKRLNWSIMDNRTNTTLIPE